VSRIGAATGEGALLWDVALAGLGVGLTQVTIVLALQNSVARENVGTASSLAQFLTNLAGTVGVTLLGVYQSNLMAEGVKPILASPALQQLPAQAAPMLGNAASLGRVLTSPAAAAQLPSQLVAALRGALENSLHSVFQVGLGLAILALLVSLFMRGSAAGQPGRVALADVAANPGDPAEE
jgi:hypothetical protein